MTRQRLLLRCSWHAGPTETSLALACACVVLKTVLHGFVSAARQPESGSLQHTPVPEATCHAIRTAGRLLAARERAAPLARLRQSMLLACTNPRFHSTVMSIPCTVCSLECTCSSHRNHVCVCMYVCMYVCVYICIYTCVYIEKYIFTYTHI